ncbi:MAG: hypothetical protein ACRENG_12360, partial [bacterium]
MKKSSEDFKPLNKLAHFSKRWRRLLQGQASRQESALDFNAQRGAFEHARWLVRFYYLLLIYFLASLAHDLWQQREEITAIELLWPVAWMRFFEAKRTLGGLICFTFVSSLLGFWLTDRRWTRALVFISLLALNALNNSFGHISHTHHALIFVTFIFILLPAATKKKSPATITHRHLYLTVFWTAQFFLALFYSISGFWKVWMGLKQMLAGQVHTFHPHALAYHITAVLLQANRESILCEMIVEHPWAG